MLQIHPKENNAGKKIILKPEKKKGFQFREAKQDEATNTQVYKNHSWSRMLARVFKIDVTRCEACGGKMQKICAIIDGDSIRRYLKHLSLDPEPPKMAPAASWQREIYFEEEYQTA